MADDSWRFLDVYRNQSLGTCLDSLVERYHLSDETARFSKLVNISESKSSPFHRWARYREGYSGDLVKELIRRSEVDGGLHIVVDPMCGSGSTLVAAKELGIDSVGFDVNPFAVDLTNAKLENYTEDDLRCVDRLLEHRSEPDNKVIPSLWDGMESSRSYFNPENFRALVSIRHWIESVDNQRAKHLLTTAWLTILEDCSNRRKNGNGLSTTVTRVGNVWDCFRGRVKMLQDDIRESPLSRQAFSAAINISVLDSLPEVKILSSKRGRTPKAVIFSPPYANSFDYFETYKMELLFGGYCDLYGLAQLKKKAIRNYRIGYGRELKSDNQIVELLCQEIWSVIPDKERATGTRDGRTRLVPNMLRGYFEDMRQSIERISQMLPFGGWCHIVVDQSSYVGVVIPTDIVLASIAERNGFEVKEIVKCRNANTSGQQLKMFPHLKIMLRGSIVSLRRIGN